MPNHSFHLMPTAVLKYGWVYLLILGNNFLIGDTSTIPLSSWFDDKPKAHHGYAEPIETPYLNTPSPSKIPIQPPGKKKVPTVELCDQVPISAPDTCYEETLVSAPSPCDTEVSYNVCSAQTIEIPDTCVRIVTKEIPYKCPVQVGENQICWDIPEASAQKCKRNVLKQIPRNCPQQITVPVCTAVNTTLQSVCHRPIRTGKEYTCHKLEPEKKCFKDIIQRKSLCHRRVIKEQITQKKTECRDVIKKKMTTCTRPTTREETYPCLKPNSSTRCDKIQRTEHKPCTIDSSEEIWEDCSEVRERVITRKCPKKRLIEAMQTTCDGQEISRIINSNNDSNGFNPSAAVNMFSRGGKKGCWEQPVTREITEEGLCEETIKTREPKQCRKVIPKKIQSTCPEVVFDEVCSKVDDPIQSLCTRNVSDYEEYLCEQSYTERECTEVPAYLPYKKRHLQALRSLYGEAPRVPQKQHVEIYEDEFYDCMATEEIEKCKEIMVPKAHTCVASVMEMEDYTCTVPSTTEVCRDTTRTVQSTCLDEQTVEESIDCVVPKTRRQCQSYPVYANEGLCSVVVPQVEEYACSRQALTVQCRVETSTVSRMCFTQSSEKQPYTCYRQGTESRCMNVPQVPQKKGGAPPKK